MKKIANLFWSEPAVVIGALVSAALFVVKWQTGVDFGEDDLLAVLSPFAASLGIRQLVTPAKDHV
jgi:hypothetical protein